MHQLTVQQLCLKLTSRSVLVYYVLANPVNWTLCKQPDDTHIRLGEVVLFAGFVL